MDAGHGGADGRDLFCVHLARLKITMEGDLYHKAGAKLRPQPAMYTETPRSRISSMRDASKQGVLRPRTTRNLERICGLM